MGKFFRGLQKRAKEYSGKEIGGNDGVKVSKRVREILSAYHKKYGEIKSDQDRENFLKESYETIIDDPTIELFINDDDYGQGAVKIFVLYHVVQYANNKITIEEDEDHREEELYQKH